VPTVANQACQSLADKRVFWLLRYFHITSANTLKTCIETPEFSLARPSCSCRRQKNELTCRKEKEKNPTDFPPYSAGHLKYPNNLDQSLNDAAAEKIRKYRADYNNRPPSEVSFIPDIPSTSGRLHSEFVRLLFLQSHRESDHFFVTSGVQSAESTSGGFFHFLRAAFRQQFKTKVGLALSKTVALCIVLNLDGAPIVSKSHTHPSHSQTSRLLTSSLSLCLPVPRPTQCVRVT
jgi:hypothetical protein